MKKFLTVLFILIVAGVAVLLFYKPADDNQVAESDVGQPAPEKVISTAEPKAEAAPAADAKEESKDESEEASKETDASAVMANLIKTLGNIPESNIKPAPMPGWYEVANGSAIGYVSEDGRYLIDGDLVDLKTKVNLTERRRNDWRKATISKIDESKMIIFEPKQVKHTVTVFTDVDCGYCRKLHSEIQGYLDEGIRIRYVFYPLRGKEAKSYKTAENVWCSKDRNEAMTQAKQGKTVTAAACENPVGQHLQTGMEIGIRGTPGILTEGGKLLPGYMPPKTLLSELEKAAAG